MKTLRASGTRLQADVVVGSNQYGSDVTVLVTLDRKDAETIEALEPLARLLRQRAFAYLNESIEEARVQQRVDEKVSRMRTQITSAAKANAEQAAQTKVRSLERELESARRLAEERQAENERLRQQVEATTERKDG